MSELTIWDLDDPTPESDEAILLWRAFSTEGCPGVVSIPAIVEGDADNYKRRYLEWIYELGLSKCNGSKVIDRLRIRTGLSYWWLTLVSEKCNYEYSPQITNAIYMLALDDWARNKRITRVRFFSKNRKLSRCIHKWSISRNIDFVSEIRSEGHGSASHGAAHSKPVLLLQAFIRYIYYLYSRWPLRGIGLNGWRSIGDGVTFFSYLQNLNPDKIQVNEYESRYWTGLPAELRLEGKRIRWFHNYFKNPYFKTSKEAAAYLDKLNKIDVENEVHVTMDSFLSIRGAINIIVDWAVLILKSRNIERCLSQVKANDLDLWPLISDDWRRSIYGEKAILNLIYLNLLEASMACGAGLGVGIYLYEQQSWELALIHAWKHAGQGRLIGAQHAAMLYWDLRYFHDARSYARTDGNDLPMPDIVAVNGPLSLGTCIQAGYPISRIAEVEALRYSRLSNTAEMSRKRARKHSGHLRLLVLCDFLKANASKQLNLLSSAVKLGLSGVRIIVKPHPICPLSANEFPDLVMTISDEPIENMLAEADVVFTSNATSAALDAYCSHVPVITMQDGGTLNMSPLRGVTGVTFVGNAKQLFEVLKTMDKRLGNEPANAVFKFGAAFTEWRRLLNF